MKFFSNTRFLINLFTRTERLATLPNASDINTVVVSGLYPERVIVLPDMVASDIDTSLDRALYGALPLTIWTVAVVHSVNTIELCQSTSSFSDDPTVTVNCAVLHLASNTTIVAVPIAFPLIAIRLSPLSVAVAICG